MAKVPRDPRTWAACALVMALQDMQTLDAGSKVILHNAYVRGRPMWEAWAESRDLPPDDKDLLDQGIRALNELLSNAIDADETRRDAVDEVQRLLGEPPSEPAV